MTKVFLLAILSKWLVDFLLMKLSLRPNSVNLPICEGGSKSWYVDVPNRNPKPLEKIECKNMNGLLRPFREPVNLDNIMKKLILYTF